MDGVSGRHTKIGRLFWIFLFFVPDPKVIEIGLVPVEIGEGEIPAAVKVGVYGVAVRTKISTCCKSLQWFVHRGWVPYRKNAL